MTFQGLIPFYYREVNEGESSSKNVFVSFFFLLTREVVESEVLNRCEYNNMRDNPYTKDETECRGPVKGVKICQDCREVRKNETRVLELGPCFFFLTEGGIFFLRLRLRIYIQRISRYVRNRGDVI